MAEKSLFWTTNGTGDGTSGGYTAQEFYDFLRRLLITDQEASQGVLRGVDNELAVTGSSTPLSLATGSAIAYGFFYNNSSALDLSVTTPVVGTTGGRVNLKVDWTAQTVRGSIQLNTDGTATIPTLTQTAGSEWNLPLYTFTVTTAGVITLTDVRSYCQFANYLTATSFYGVTGLSVIGRSINSAGQSAAITAGTDAYVLRRSGTTIGFGQVATDGIADDAITAAKILAGAVGSAEIDTGAVGTDELAADSVDDTKAGNRVPQFYRRQGGDTSDWNSPGTTTYTPTSVRMQGGMEDINLGVGVTTATVAITFPTAFSNVPLIYVTMQLRSGMNPDTYTYTPFVDSVSASAVTLRITRSAATDGSVTPYIQWLAIGPE